MEIPQRLTDAQLQNFLIKAEALVNSRPLTEIPNHPDKPALTPNHFLFGSSNGESDETVDDEQDTEKVYERLLQERHEHQELLAHFWDRWAKEYLPLIAARKKWGRKTEPLQSGDVVYICEPTAWLKGIVDDVFYDPETDQVREVIVRTAQRKYRRAATNVAKIRTSGTPKNNNKETSDKSRTEQQPGPQTRSRTGCHR